jgi:outer membrane receptor for ferrienterochelin and colicins
VSDDHRSGLYLFGMLKNRQPYDHNRDGFSDIPLMQSETAGFRTYYRPTIYTRLTAEYHHISDQRRGGNSFDKPLPQADIAEYLHHTIDGGGITFDLFSPNEQHRLALYTSAQAIRRASYFAAEQNTENYGNTDDNTLLLGAQYTLHLPHLLFMPAELTAGAEFNHNDLHDAYPSLNRDLRQTTRITGGYLQNEWKNEQLGILIGARLDRHNLMDKAVFSPRATLRYNLNPHLHLRAGYAGGYRAPQAYDEDLHVEAVGGSLSTVTIDPNLKPEYSHSLTASADLYHAFGGWQTHFLLEAFHTTLIDLFTLEKIEDNDTNGYTNGNPSTITYLRRNSSGATVQGINLEARAALPGVFDIQVGYTLQQSRYKEAEQWSDSPNLTPQRRIFRSPDNYAYFVANAPLTRHLYASLFGTYTGSMLVQHIQPDTNPFTVIPHPAILTTDANPDTEATIDTEFDTPTFFDLGIKFSYCFHISGNAELELSGGLKNIFNSYQRDLDYITDPSSPDTKDSGYIYGPTHPRTPFLALKLTL